MEIYLGIEPSVLFMTEKSLRQLDRLLHSRGGKIYTPWSIDENTQMFYWDIPIYVTKNPKVAANVYNYQDIPVTAKMAAQIGDKANKKFFKHKKKRTH